MKIEGISLSEFNDISGFQLVFTVPSQAILTQQQFNLCSELILPREQLCNRILAIEYKNDYFLVGVALLSMNKGEDKAYSRQKYIYSLAMLVQKQAYLDKTKQPLYKQLIWKIARFFKVIEESNHIIYKHKLYSQYIQNILADIFEQINSKNSCDLSYLCNHYSFINVKHPQTFQKSTKICLSSVPVTLLSQKQIQKIQSQFGQALLRYAFEGNYTFKKIYKLHREKKQIEIKKFYEKGIEKGVIFIVDLFSLKNVYILTEQIQQFFQNQPKYKIMSQIAMSVAQNVEKIGVDEILCLYLQFNRATPLFKIIERNKKLTSKINILKLIRLGQIYGFLQRIHQKIVFLSNPTNLIVQQQLRKYIKEKEKSKIDMYEKHIIEQESQIISILKNHLVSNDTLDQVSVSLDIYPSKLLKIITEENRLVLQIHP